MDMENSTLDSTVCVTLSSAETVFLSFFSFLMCLREPKNINKQVSAHLLG